MAVKNIFFRDLKLKKDFAEWRVANNNTRRMLDDMLKILIDCGLDFLKDSRTLKGTPRDINTSAKCSGEFIYLGLKMALHKYLEKFHCDEDNLKLAINTDRIPLFKSSSEQL